jgi:hypothetical protein
VAFGGAAGIPLFQAAIKFTLTVILLCKISLQIFEIHLVSFLKFLFFIIFFLFIVMYVPFCVFCVLFCVLLLA